MVPAARQFSRADGAVGEGEIAFYGALHAAPGGGQIKSNCDQTIAGLTPGSTDPAAE